jgi:class 3 adenylate cyclase
MGLQPPTVGGSAVTVTCQIGIARGPVFSAEIGEPRGRREFNVLGDTVNTAARLMGRAGSNQILMTEAVYERIAHRFDCDVLEPIVLKGKAAPTPVFALSSAPDG